MKFGPVAVDRAAGHVLAHSVRLPGGRLRKGKVLEQEDCRALAQAGIAEITVAQLELGDVDENSAAAELAAALIKGAGGGLTPGKAFTGRVNLLADGAGLARLDVAAINRVNRVHPMITVATVPPWQRMDPDGMVATVKIIAYAVPSGDLARACSAAEGALALQRPAIQRAAFIETRVPGPKTGQSGDKGFRMMQARLDRLNVALDAPMDVPHQTGALADAIGQTDAPLVLILTGSATSDVTDVAPGAVRRAGGEIVHFGMPVDPGNLMFLARKGPQYIIGLPGSARSPAVSGVDWILERIICGLDVTPADIMGMGVGGLLKEIPTRPQPRQPDR